MKLILSLLGLLWLAQPAHADFAAGVAAYDAGRYAEAVQEWETAARGGDLAAMRNLGHLYRQGMGTTKDLNKSAFWYKNAAEAGMARAQYNLGMLYLDGGEKFPPNPKEAQEWFKKAAAQGHEAALKHLQQTAAKEENHTTKPVKVTEPPKENVKKSDPIQNKNPETINNLLSDNQMLAQIGTFNSHEDALSAWKLIEHPDNISPIIRTLGDEDAPKTTFRLYAIGEAEQMRDFCTILRLNDLPCALQPWQGN